LRNRLKYALTGREVTAILMQRLVEVDGKVRTDKTYPAGFMGELVLTFRGLPVAVQSVLFCSSLLFSAAQTAPQSFCNSSSLVLLMFLRSFPVQPGIALHLIP
jgi:hypothetical protein